MEKFENFIIKPEKGFSLLADLYLAKGSKRKPIVIFCHGFKGFKDWGPFPLLPSYVTDSGFHFLKFNFSHNGGSLENGIDFPDLELFGRNNYCIELNDLQTVLNWICDKKNLYASSFNPDEIYLVGHSRGGAISIITASEDKRIKKLVTWSALSDFARRFPNARDLEKWKKDGVYYVENLRTKQKMPLYYQFYENYVSNRQRLSIAENEKKLLIPHLLIHGTQDETVYIGEALYLVSLNEKASLIKINGGTHTLGGYHPYKENKLPLHTEMAMKYTLTFFQNE